MRWLVLRLEAPLAAFGGEAIDARGPTRDFPALSALTGLLANALGYDRCETDRLQSLQDRLVFAARREAEPLLGRMTDFQTAQLGAGDRGWTTRGRPEGRDGGASTYKSPHIRRRDYHADLRMRCVVALEGGGSPTLDDLAEALDRPARPLFLGRKPCLPSAPLFAGFVEAPSAREALAALPAPLDGPGAALRAVWPVADGEGDRIVAATEERVWRSDLHGGRRRSMEGRILPRAAEEPDP